jgi:hypothetical protein
VTIEQEGGRWQRLQPRERALIIIVGIIATLALVYILFLSGGDGGPEAFPTFTPRPTTTSTARPIVSPTPTPSTPPETFEVFEGKDPFRPLVVAGGGGGDGVAPGPQPTGSPSSGGASGSQHVTLIAISGSGADRTATVEVNSTQYDVKEGDTFAGSYRVKNLTSDCGTFVFGDETFTLCTGQEVLK